MISIEKVTNGYILGMQIDHINGVDMISIEKVTNGYIVRIEEADEDATLVCQREFNSMNVALGAMCKLLLDRWQDKEETINVKLDVSP